MVAHLTMEDHIEFGKALKKIKLKLSKSSNSKKERAKHEDLVEKYITKLKDRMEEIMFRDHIKMNLDEHISSLAFKVYYGDSDNNEESLKELINLLNKKQ